MAWEGGRSGRGISVAASAAVALALGWLGIGFLHAAYLKYAALDSPAYAMFLLRRGWLWCHLAGGGLGVVLGLVQLLTQRWPRLWRVHRVSGRVYFAAMLVAMVGAVGLIATSPAPMGIRVAFGSTLLAWLVTGGAGLVAGLSPGRGGATVDRRRRGQARGRRQPGVEVDGEAGRHGSRG